MISNKFKHGDIVSFLDNNETLYEIITINNISTKPYEDRIRSIIRESYGHKTVILKELKNPSNISWTNEANVQIANKGQLLLYGPADFKKTKRTRKRKAR